jgi:malonate-semialdehyde dehydrogenase (acetylating)/methylmalonate-semialdehyde dehydrogenase
MALPVVVPVGEETAERLKEKLLKSIAALRRQRQKTIDYHPRVASEYG